MAVITRTADPAGANGSSNVATYSAQSIGDPFLGRIVVIAATCELASTPINSCTIDYGSGDVSMTAGSLGNFNDTQYARLFYLAVKHGATATIKVTFGTNTPNSTQNHISIYTVAGAAYSSSGSSTSTDMDASTPLTTGAITIVSGGAFIAVANGATDTTTSKTWANATEDLEDDAGAYTHTTSYRTTALSATAVTCTGSTNGEDGSLSWIIFDPSDAKLNNYQSAKGSSSNTGILSFGERIR